MPRISKKFALLLVLAMMATMFVGMGTASAASTNTALTVPTIAIDPNTAQSLGTIQVQETTVGAIGATAAVGGQVYEQVVVTLPYGTEFASNSTTVTDFIAVPELNSNGVANCLWGGAANPTAYFSIASNNKQTLVINVLGRDSNRAGAGMFQILFNTANSKVVVSSGAADLVVNLLDSTGAVTSGDVIVAHVAVGGTSTYALSVPTVSQASGQILGTIRIVENFARALNNASNANGISITLPQGVTFDAKPDISLTGGFSAGDITVGEPTTNTSGLSKVVLTVVNKSHDLAGVIDIKPTVTIDMNATKGDIVATIGGTNTNITPTTVVIGKYGEYGITAACDNPTNIYAGRVDVKIGTPVMTENVFKTLIKDRSLYLELPEGCKWKTVPTPVPTKSSLVLTKGGTNGDGILAGSYDRIATYKVTTESQTVPGVVEFRQGTISVPADFPAGDLSITFGGTAGAVADDSSKVSVKVATIISPVTITGATPSPTIIIGAQNQTDTAFDVVEAGVGAIAAKGSSPTTTTTWTVNGTTVTSNTSTVYSNYNSELLIVCPSGVSFSELPEISVTGDLKIDTNGVKLSSNDSTIIIPITTSSTTTASTLSFKNVHFTVDRTVPQGAMKLSVTGSAVDQWYRYYSQSSYVNAAKGQVANVTTPAPDQQNKVATFVVGQSKFTLEGVEITMDVAPYIKDSRTFLPIAYVAQALGIDAANIIWDAANQTVTLMKGDKVLQLKVGSTTMLVNGAAVSLDAAPEINNSRTCLPIALVAKAFGETASWDAATQTITIQ